MFKHLLLCTHGTPGAQLAEQLVYDNLLIRQPDLDVTVLTVINEDWKHMTGDDWLNTSTTRNQFRLHISHQLSKEIETDWKRLRGTYPASESHNFIKTIGQVEDTITETARANHCDLIVIGPYQKKRSKGFRARMKNERLHLRLPCPLMIAPYNKIKTDIMFF